ncbi:putative galacturonosyltransferase 3 [Camellia lanceoleosa]|uniref:Galacturonosyltransferase 3 n=1 Tax=Camellia lanceoleosa TaxID=1840588 RepID=A0ACC0F2M5_9ERIC|nr:putative galacturonosyltransferase 3 [Camellia lanceoleosa]
MEKLILMEPPFSRMEQYILPLSHHNCKDSVPCSRFLANEDRTLWKLGTLPPGLITFYKLTYPLERSWHVLGLGYDPALNKTEIENAAVIHYNGNNKPWLDLAISKYKSYWSRCTVKYLMVFGLLLLFRTL